MAALVDLPRAANVDPADAAERDDAKHANRMIDTADDTAESRPRSPKRRRSGRDTNRIRMSSGRHGALHIRRMEELFFEEDGNGSDSGESDEDDAVDDTKSKSGSDSKDALPAPRRSQRQAKLQEQREKQELERKKGQEESKQKEIIRLQKPHDAPAVVYPIIKIQKLSLQRVYGSPNIYIIDDFLTESELEYLETTIIGNNIPFQKSYVDNPRTTQTLQDDAHRTSSFVSLRKHQSSKIAAIEDKAATLLGLFNSTTTIEPLQLVRYLPGQFFGVHHDMGDYDEETGVVELPPKHCFVQRRLVTIFCYLNDLQDGQGGCTMFPNCKHGGDGSPLRVQPRRGRAVVWSNVTQDGYPDARTIHAGEPVIDNRVNIADADQRKKEKDVGHDNKPLPSSQNKSKNGSRKMRARAVVKYGLNIWMLET